ncbi:MAG: superoxide dismutase, Ni [Lentisphaerales bacterium]|nr:superoxide dismutase, Ni [Lentisphaerales bacterium]
MINQIINTFESILPVEETQAHCDIPCKIYDPAPAQLATLSLIRMVDLIEEFQDKEKTIGWQNKMNRFISEKERQGFIVKEEIRIIWGDFFKAPQFEKYPELHELSHSIMMLASKSKQEVDKQAALDLLTKVNRFAEIFWDLKGIKTKKAVCPYPPAQEVVYPEL